jgi:hypothetical protein
MLKILRLATQYPQNSYDWRILTSLMMIYSAKSLEIIYNQA